MPGKRKRKGDGKRKPHAAPSHARAREPAPVAPELEETTAAAARRGLGALVGQTADRVQAGLVIDGKEVYFAGKLFMEALASGVMDESMTATAQRVVQVFRGRAVPADDDKPARAAADGA